MVYHCFPTRVSPFVIYEAMRQYMRVFEDKKQKKKDQSSQTGPWDGQRGKRDMQNEVGAEPSKKKKKKKKKKVIENITIKIIKSGTPKVFTLIEHNLNLQCSHVSKSHASKRCRWNGKHSRSLSDCSLGAIRP